MATRLSTLLFILLINMLTITHVCANNQSVDPKLRQLLTEAINSSTSFEDRFHAEVWLLDMSNRLKQFVKDEKTRLAILKQVHYEASRVKLQPELILAVIEVESHFNSYAISTAGAQGLMQVMPFWLD